MHTPRTPPALSRRQVLAGAALALPWLGLPQAHANETTLKLGQSTALTGPLGDLGTAIHEGAKAAFAAINAKGGIHGRQIVLQTQDDGYEVPRALANVDGFLANRECFALFNCFGTPFTEAVMPKIKDSGMPFFAPLTGGQVSRVAGMRNVFNIRASYAEEAAKCIQHLATVGAKRIAVVYQNNTFGKEVLDGANKAMEHAKLPAAPTATVENNASDAASAAQKMADANPEAIIVGLAGKPALEFIKAFRPLRPGVTVYALSVLGTAANIKALGNQAAGLVVAQVVPLPSNAGIPVVREFQAALKAAGSKAEPSHLALEGYINARVFAEALQRAGKNPTRTAFVDATWSLKKIDLGGFEINASVPENNASRFVELTMATRSGQFVR